MNKVEILALVEDECRYMSHQQMILWLADLCQQCDELELENKKQKEIIETQRKRIQKLKENKND